MIQIEDITPKVGHSCDPIVVKLKTSQITAGLVNCFDLAFTGLVSDGQVLCLNLDGQKLEYTFLNNVTDPCTQLPTPSSAGGNTVCTIEFCNVFIGPASSGGGFGNNVDFVINGATFTPSYLGNPTQFLQALEVLVPAITVDYSTVSTSQDGSFKFCFSYTHNAAGSVTQFEVNNTFGPPQFLFQDLINDTLYGASETCIGSALYTKSYGEILLDHFNLNFHLLCNYEIDCRMFNGDLIMTFCSLGCEPIEVSIDVDTTTATNIDLDDGNVDQVQTTTDLAYITTIKKNSDGTQEKITSQQACFDKQGRADIDIHKVFCLSAHRPVDASYTDVSPRAAWDAFCVYQIIAAEKKEDGSLDCFVRSADCCVAIFGSKSCDNPTEYFSETLTILHNYKSCEQLEVGFRKCINLNQPDWLYFFASVDQNITVNVNYILADGTTGSITPLNQDPVLGNQVHYIGSGPGQLGLPRNVDYYTVELVNNLGVTIDVVKYQIQCECDPNDCYIIFENGCGGVESINLKGSKVPEFEVKKLSYKRAKTASTATDPTSNKPVLQRQRGSTSITGRRYIDLSSGWMDINMIGHLRQLIISSEVWLYDQDKDLLIPVDIETKKIKIPARKDQISCGQYKQGNFDLRVSFSFDDCAYNC